VQVLGLNVDINTIINLVGFLLGLGGIAGVARYQIKELSGRMEAVEQSLGKLTEILLAQERHTGRMNVMDERLTAQGKRLDEVSARFDRYLNDREPDGR